MDPILTPEQPVFDRRQIYRPFLERINPIASMHTVFEQELIVTPGGDPSDPTQPAIHEAFATAAELQPGVQMALVGGVGSGKTTELLLTKETLKRHPDAINLYMEAADFTDFLHVNPGAMLAIIGLRLISQYRELFGEPTGETATAHESLRRLGLGRSEWCTEDPRDPYDGEAGFRLDIPGLMRPRFPELKGEVAAVASLLDAILRPFVENGNQVTAGVFQIEPETVGGVS